ncbi:rhodanese-like domain-containing protein [Streptomyces scabiei]|uniref:rhodanese-like domain-containing protein n=1 Tax=Streptomyces scabiei TaxID=1930 RepID=UPI0038D3AAEB
MLTAEQVVVDVRTPGEYTSGHLPGADNVPRPVPAPPGPWTGGSAASPDLSS